MAKKTKVKKVVMLEALDEFQVGKHGIGWVDSDFKTRFGGQKFAPKALGSFQKLPRYMTDAEIESELKPGLCDLGDVLAFLKNPPEEAKDGYSNIFYTPAFVVHVGWDGSHWDVNAWQRDGYGWRGGYRVFSPATGTLATLNSSDTLTLEAAIKLVKKEGYKIFKEI